MAKQKQTKQTKQTEKLSRVSRDTPLNPARRPAAKTARPKAFANSWIKAARGRKT